MSLGSENIGRQKAPIQAPAPGEIIAGKYQVEGLIGAGGMGVVVAARHLQLDKRVAVKLLHADTSLQSNAALRFVREARAAASLRSEHVAQIMDVDKLPSGAPYMVMEYLAGSSLSKVVRERAPMPVAEAVDYVLQACEAIAEAHSLGIVHRDLKPGNLFLTQRPDGSPLVKVLDFGISKIIGPEDEQDLTATNVVLGSPQYASPEQLRSLKSTDSRTDIWALGVILYYMLTGRRPFEGETLSSLFIAISNDQPLPCRAHRADLPADLETIVMRCLEKNRERRVQTIDVLVRSLKPFAPTYGRASGAGESRASQNELPVGPVVPSSLQVASPVVPMSLVLPVSAGGGGGSGVIEGELVTGGTRRTWSAPTAPSRGTPLWLIQAGVAVIALVALVLVVVHFRRGAAPESAKIEGVVGDEGATVVVPPPAPAPSPSPEAATSPAPEGTFVAPPVGGISPVTSAVKRPNFAVDGAGTGQIGISRAKLKLTSKPGGGASIGELAAGELVVVTADQGEFFRISHAGTGKIIMGWTPKKTIRLE